MAWNAPATQSAGTLITPAIWSSQIIENLLYLKSKPAKRGAFATFDTTSTTFVPLSSAENITTATGGRVLILANGWAQHLESGLCFFFLDLLMDGSTYAYGGGSGSGGTLGFLSTGGPEAYPWAFFYVTDVLSAAFHTFRLYGRKAAGGGTQGAVRFTIRNFLLLEV